MEDVILNIAKSLVGSIKVKEGLSNQDLLVDLTFQLIQQVEIAGHHLRGPQKMKAVQCALLELVEQHKHRFVDTLPTDFIHEMVPLMVTQAVKLANGWSSSKKICCVL